MIQSNVLIRQTILSILIVCVWTYSFSALADNNHVYMGAWSFHQEEPVNGTKLNETNYLVGVQYNNVFVGTFNNSFRDRTYVVGGYIPTFLEDTPIEVSFLVGASYGYRECYDPSATGNKQRVCGVVVPEITLNMGRLKPSLLILNSSTQVLTFKWEF